MMIYFYGCRDCDDPLEDGDLFMLSGQAECKDYVDARKRAASIMPNDFVGYVLFTDLVGGANKSDILVNGVHVDNRENSDQIEMARISYGDY
jgi:hypothetical protein